MEPPVKNGEQEWAIIASKTGEYLHIYHHGTELDSPTGYKLGLAVPLPLSCSGNLGGNTGHLLSGKGRDLDRRKVAPVTRIF
ncbi:hypothetical protein PoB_000680200 [Plakobranchus ocellatus]|uniref:Uncharacterized protein n=1 Tax=Plakobranchus ocellatus TaxID=259542 RepID=A0AAV3YBP1_9GAST|nr:hypothetical protein PoB_000680200 [Plakobranchus ocellatus]